MLINALRGHLAEFGVIAPQGPRHVVQLIAAVRDEAEDRVPALARRVLAMLVEQLEELAAKLAAHRSRAAGLASRQPDQPAAGDDPWDRAGDRQHPGGDGARPRAPSAAGGKFARLGSGWCRAQHSSGGKARLGKISKRGDAELRRLLIIGAQAVLRWPKAVDANPWLRVAARPAAAPGRGGRAGQQDCAHRPSAGKRRPPCGDGSTALRSMGGHAPRRRIPAHGGVTAVRDGLSLRGQERVMVDRSSEGARATWFVQRAYQARQNVEASRRGTHQGQRS